MEYSIEQKKRNLIRTKKKDSFPYSQLTPAISELTEPESRPGVAPIFAGGLIGRTIVGKSISKFACSLSAGSYNSYCVNASILRSSGSPASSPLILVNV